MPAKSKEALERKRQKDNERRRLKRLDPEYRAQEAAYTWHRRQFDEEYQERERERAAKRDWRKKVVPIPPELDDWLIFDWANGYIERRGGIEAYRPLLEQLHQSDLKKHVVRLCVYETTPLKVELRKEMPMVWQTHRSATIRVPNAPLIKRFKVLDPKDPNPIPIGEGELVRKYLYPFKSKKGWIFPRCRYRAVLDTPVFFVPSSPPDLVEFDVEYVDISRCYSQLLERLPSLAVEFDYPRRRFDRVPRLPRYDRSLLASKHFGRAVVGMLRQQKGRVFVYGEPVAFPSKFYHGDTANWVHGVLHCLADYAISECGCFRWHTDGGMFPEGGGSKFVRLLDSLGLAYTLEEFAAVMFASMDQYEGVYYDGSVKQTRGFLSTYIDDFIFNPVEGGGGQRDNIARGMDSAWFYKTLERV